MPFLSQLIGSWQSKQDELHSDFHLKLQPCLKARENVLVSKLKYFSITLSVLDNTGEAALELKSNVKSK